MAPDLPDGIVFAVAVAIHRVTCPLTDDPDHDCARAVKFGPCVYQAEAALEAGAPAIRAAERARAYAEIRQLAAERGATYPGPCITPLCETL